MYLKNKYLVNKKEKVRLFIYFFILILIIFQLFLKATMLYSDHRKSLSYSPANFIFWSLFQASVMLLKLLLDLEERVTSINLFTMATAESQSRVVALAHNRGFIFPLVFTPQFKTHKRRGQPIDIWCVTLLVVLFIKCAGTSG